MEYEERLKELMHWEKSLHKSTSNVSILGASFQAVTSIPEIEMKSFLVQSVFRLKHYLTNCANVQKVSAAINMFLIYIFMFTY